MNKPPDRPRRDPIFPRPPRSKSMVEFVVLVFALSVSVMLVLTVVGAVVYLTIHPKAESGPWLNTIADIMTTLVGALIGYIAGKGQGRLEEQDQDR